MKRNICLLILLFCSVITIAQNKTKQTASVPKKSTIPKKVTEKLSPTNLKKELQPIVEPQNVQIGIPTALKVEPIRNYDYTNSDLLVKWHELIFELIEQTQGYSPNVAARNMAYINLAAYEAILPANLENITLSEQLQEFHRPDSLNIDGRSFNASVALNSTIFKLVDKFFISAPFIWMEKVYALNDSVNNYFARQLSTNAMENSKIYGAKIASWIYEYSKGDGGHQAFMRTYNMNYNMPKCQSCFELNIVADLENMGSLHPSWGNNRTFLAINQEEINIQPKVEFSIYPNSPFYKMAQEVYTISKQVVPNSEKLQIANFWDDAAGFTYTAPGHSVSILTQVLKQKPIKLNSAAELYSNLTIAVNDALIATWTLKYKYNLIRPIAYIKRYIDNQWEAALLTPPFPEFPSGHSAQSATMATVLTSKLGDSISFVDYSKYFVGPPKSFNSFWEAANECSISRVYGGIHYRDAVDQGQELGRIIGKNALTLHYLK